MRRTRREILEENGLTVCPSDVQKFFWRRYNFQVRRRVGLLGDVAAEVVLRQGGRPVGELARLTEAWRAILPVEVGARTQVESFSGGCLRVTVDCAATRYVLTRQLAGELITALNEMAGPTRVQRLDCRIGNHRDSLKGTSRD